MTSIAFNAAWMPAPTEQAKVSAAEDAAAVASTEAQLRWREYLEALEENADIERRQAAFEVASAHARYAWAVYHSTRVDASARSADTAA